ncbi:hypothetical protein ACFE04_031854 [Oxalis oulophora]
MFGPESGKDSWAGLPFMYDKVRIGNESDRLERCEKFLDIFKKEGCKMVEMSCAEHDRYAAESQFVTHLIGRVLGKLGLVSSEINTKGYNSVLELVKNTEGDSFDLFLGLILHNKNSLQQLVRVVMALQEIMTTLFGELHRVYRKQLFGQKRRWGRYWQMFWCVAVGLWVGLVIGFVTESCTSNAMLTDVKNALRKNQEHRRRIIMMKIERLSI